MTNIIQEAYEKASQDDRLTFLKGIAKEVLAPVGVESFAQLKEKVESLEESESEFIQLSESLEESKSERGRKSAFEILKGAGVDVKEANDVRVDAYLGLQESKQPEFVKLLQSKVKASSAKEPTLTEDQKKILAESLVLGGKNKVELTEAQRASLKLG